MKQAYFYDTNGGYVYLCQLMGVDGSGHAQWLVITPGEESKLLQEMAADYDSRFIMISDAQKAASSVMIARVLGAVLKEPMGKLPKELQKSLQRMETLGLKWNKESLMLETWVFENLKDSRCAGKYSFVIRDRYQDMGYLTNVDGFDDLETLFCWIGHFISVLNNVAWINTAFNRLCISDKLKAQMSEKELEMFDDFKKDEWVERLQN